MMVRVPKRFFDDTFELADEAPVVLRANKTHCWIDKDDPLVSELIDRADLYADFDNFPAEYHEICRSARATLKCFNLELPTRPGGKRLCGGKGDER